MSKSGANDALPRPVDFLELQLRPADRRRLEGVGPRFGISFPLTPKNHEGDGHEACALGFKFADPLFQHGDAL